MQSQKIHNLTRKQCNDGIGILGQRRWIEQKKKNQRYDEALNRIAK